MRSELHRVAVDPNRVSETERLKEYLKWRLRSLATKNDVSPETLREAARDFDAYAKSALEDEGYAPTTSAVALIVGEERTHYTSALSGRRFSVQRLFSWWARWIIAFTPEDELPFPSCSSVPKAHHAPPRGATPAKPLLKKEEPVEKPLSTDQLSMLARLGIRPVGAAAAKPTEPEDDDRGTT